jgi:hypothetical protein
MARWVSRARPDRKAKRPMKSVGVGQVGKARLRNKATWLMIRWYGQVVRLDGYKSKVARPIS